MGGVVGSLFCLWVKSGFSAQRVAAALTFLPPAPSYDLEKDESTGNWKRRHILREGECTDENVRIVQLTTKLGNQIPGISTTFHAIV